MVNSGIGYLRLGPLLYMYNLYWDIKILIDDIPVPPPPTPLGNEYSLPPGQNSMYRYA